MNETASEKEIRITRREQDDEDTKCFHAGRAPLHETRQRSEKTKARLCKGAGERNPNVFSKKDKETQDQSKRRAKIRRKRKHTSAGWEIHMRPQCPKIQLHLHSWQSMWHEPRWTPGRWPWAQEDDSGGATDTYKSQTCDGAHSN